MIQHPFSDNTEADNVSDGRSLTTGLDIYVSCYLGTA